MISFFNAYPEFYNTSFGAGPNRLNNRYVALIENNKEIISGSSILDIASHDGRWSFAAIKNGANFCLGIEGRAHLIENANKNFQKYEIPTEKYSFKLGDIHEEIKKLPSNKFDVVFCFGFFYHTCYHLLLLSEIKRLNPKYLILDTAIVPDDKPIIQLVSNDPKKEGAAINTRPGEDWVLEGRPSKTGLEMLLNYFGLEYSYFNWRDLGIKDWTGIEDYENNVRLTLVINMHH